MAARAPTPSLAAPPWPRQFPPPGQPVPGAARELELPVLLVKCQRSPGNDQRDSSPCPQGHAVLLLPTACPRPCCPGCPRDLTVPASRCQPTLQDSRPSLSFVHLFRKTTNQPPPSQHRTNKLYRGNTEGLSPNRTSCHSTSHPCDINLATGPPQSPATRAGGAHGSPGQLGPKPPAAFQKGWVQRTDRQMMAQHYCLVPSALGEAPRA